MNRPLLKQKGNKGEILTAPKLNISFGKAHLFPQNRQNESAPQHTTNEQTINNH